MPNSNFIHLKNLLLANYNFIYEIDENCIEPDIKTIGMAGTLKFKSLKNKTQHLNLMMIESNLPDILWNIILNLIKEENYTLETTFINKDFKQLSLKKEIETSTKYQLKKFLHHLLFSTISSSNVFNGTMENDRIYYCKMHDGELKYFSVFELNDLLDVVYSKSYFQIDIKKSFIKNRKGTFRVSIKIK